MPCTSHQVASRPMSAEIATSQAPRRRMLRWLATMIGSMLRLGCETVSTPIRVRPSAGSKIGAATCMTVGLSGSVASSGLERAPYSPRKVR